MVIQIACLQEHIRPYGCFKGIYGKGKFSMETVLQQSYTGERLRERVPLCSKQKDLGRTTIKHGL